ncbi:helix-turn-helix transcriptional regulator [Photobacterium damselae]|uniref:helix-turn-helix transcriptional regulator n=1 Tax=Photobacterium damselae TaxID=38293 RepID=UPI001EFE5D8A|nr:helix-turn-helix transcriptional regulator [Photobacterium damselae]MCG9778836.1 helix-turn-helix transcriptional regulator [Photobacterium damselae]
MFSELIQKFRQDKNLTQSDCVDLLSKRVNDLSKLDNVTFSRWENKKTLPTLTRQFLIMDCLGMLKDYVYFSPKKDILESSVFNKYLNLKFDNEDDVLDCISNADKIERVILNYDDINIDRFVKDYCFDVLDSNFDTFEYKYLVWMSDNKINAFLFYYIDTTTESINFFFFALNKISYKKLFAYLYNEILSYNFDIVNIYTIGDKEYNLFKKLHGNIVQTLRINNDVVKTKISFNRMKFLSNKHIFNFYKSI